MNVMGDWAKGYFTTDLKLKPGKTSVGLQPRAPKAASW